MTHGGGVTRDLETFYDICHCLFVLCVSFNFALLHICEPFLCSSEPSYVGFMIYWWP